MTTSALLLATTAASDGRPAAALRIEGSTILARLLGQLDSLGAGNAWVVTRPEWRSALERSSGGGARATIVEARTVAEDLRTVADVAGRLEGPVLIGCAHVVTHREALAGILADPRDGTAALTSGPRGGRAGSGPFASRTEGSPIRSVGPRVTSAGSAYHRVADANGSFLGVVRVEAGDRAALASVAAELADLAATGRLRPEGDADERDEARAAKRAAGDGALDDAASLLLVGLVRNGAPVYLRKLGGFFHATPLSPQEADDAETDLRTYDEERLALDAAVKEKDGFFTTFFVSPYSKYLARFAARRGWSPNALTAIALGIGVTAAACFATGERSGLVAGAVLIQLAFVVDCVDGQLARYARRFSNLGAWLDSMFDRMKEYAVYAGLALGASRGFGEDVWALAATAVAIQTVRHVVDLSFEARPRSPVATTAGIPLERRDDTPDRRGPDSADEAPLEVGGTLAAMRPHVAAAPTRAPTSGKPRPTWRLARRAVAVNEALERHPATRWGKRIFVLPIGERFALISLTAALATPRVTFVALVAWGAVAAVYALGARTATAVAE